MAQIVVNVIVKKTYSTGKVELNLDVFGYSRSLLGKGVE
jgi:hypothetical protein